MKSTLTLLVIALMLTAGAFAADVAGTWKASMEGGPGGEVTFVFKVDGNKLGGTASSEMSGEAPITEGKIDGNEISFTVAINANGQDMKILHKGTVNGNEIKLTVTFAGMDQTMEMTAKRVK